MKTKILVPVLLLLIFSTQQSATLYSQCTETNLGQNVGNYVVGYTKCGQSFTAGCTGEITSVTITYNALPSSAGDRILNIRDGNTPTSPIIYTQTIPFSSIVVGQNEIILNTPVPINMGEQNGIEITQTVPVSTSAHGVAHNDPGAYPGGQAWFGSTSNPLYDLTFEVEISLPCVPTSIIPDVMTLPDVNATCSVTSITAPTASNNCGDDITGTTATTFPITTQGTHTVVWIYNDGLGNISSQNQTVNIDDNTPPIALVGTLPNITSECSVSSITPPSAIDNCSGTLTGIPDVSFPISAQGTTIVTWTYDDGNGNITTQTQQVIIDDITDPIPNAALSNVTECFEANLATPTATDNCSGSINGVPDVALPITTPGLTVVTWTYDDGNGNVATQTQNVTVNSFSTGVTLSGFELSATASGLTYQWIDCDNGNAPISGATSQLFSPTVDGNYAVILSNGSCTDTSNCVNVLGLGLNDKNEIEISVYPNPVTDYLFIDASEEIEFIHIYGMDGKLLLNFKNVAKINVTNLHPGTYVLVVDTTEGQLKYAFVKL